MGYHEPFIGSDAIAARVLTRGELRWNHTALLPDINLAKGTPRDVRVRTKAAWLWTGRKGIIAGQAAAAIHGRVILTATPQRDVGQPIRSVRRALEQARARTPG